MNAASGLEDFPEVKPAIAFAMEQLLKVRPPDPIGFLAKTMKEYNSSHHLQKRKVRHL